MDYFNVLGVSKNATDKEIKNAYRKMAKKYHPDTYQGDKSFAEKKMQELNEAYDILSDESKRNELLREEQYKKNASKQQSTAYSYQTNYSARNNNKYTSSNYEEGSVYDFDKHFERNYNQSYSAYNYDPYIDENDSEHMYYVDFGSMIKRILSLAKKTLLIVFILIVLIIVVVISGIKYLFDSISNILESGDNRVFTTQLTDESEVPLKIEEHTLEQATFPWSGNVEEINEKLTQYKEESNLDSEIEELNKMIIEWQKNEGKQLEEDLGKELEELNKKIIEWQENN